eukprot:scaffold22347_cov71-Phaeocystis_antarctica.AAC.1
MRAAERAGGGGGVVHTLLRGVLRRAATRRTHGLRGLRASLARAGTRGERRGGGGTRSLPHTAACGPRGVCRAGIAAGGAPAARQRWRRRRRCKAGDERADAAVVSVARAAGRGLVRKHDRAYVAQLAPLARGGELGARLGRHGTTARRLGGGPLYHAERATA